MTADYCPRCHIENKPCERHCNPTTCPDPAHQLAIPTRPDDSATPDDDAINILGHRILQIRTSNGFGLPLDATPDAPTVNLIGIHFTVVPAPGEVRIVDFACTPTEALVIAQALAETAIPHLPDH